MSSGNPPSLSTNQKTAIVIGGACAAALIAGYLSYRWVRSDRNKKNDEIDSKENEPKSCQPEEPIDEKTSIALELKEKGNEAFRQKKYEKAIEYYTEALEHANSSDKHFIYGNRSAAYFSIKNFQEAANDAKKCIELKPEWPKGYFRLGKALYELKEHTESYKKLYKGILLDPKSDEMRRFLKIVESELGLSENDSRMVLENELVKSIQQEENENICKEIGLNFEEVMQIINSGIEKDSVLTILEDPTLKPHLETHSAQIIKIISEQLINNGKNEEANQILSEELNKNPDNAQLIVLQTEAQTKLKYLLF